MTLAEVNALSTETFVGAFGGIAEHSPWVAEGASRWRPFASRDDLIAAFEKAMRDAPREAQLALIRAHPGLATKAKLTPDSSSEQAGAGLDRLTQEEFAHFTALNEAYKMRFGFPFIFAVKGAGKAEIMNAFEMRIANNPEAEFATALAQIARILRFRLEDRVSA